MHQSIVLSISQNGDRVLGWNSVLGDWSRSRSFAKMENNPLFNSSGQLNPSITVLGSNVVVPSEVILLNSIVLPHKELAGSYKNQIIL